MRRAIINLSLILAAVIIFGVALALGTPKGEFGGTDAQANEEIVDLDPDFEPWYDGLWTLPGGDVESGLFALQAALGAGLLGFALGTLRERYATRAAKSQSVAADDSPPPPNGG